MLGFVGSITIEPNGAAVESWAGIAPEHRRKWSALMGRLCSQQVAPSCCHDLLIYKSRSQPRNLPMHSVHRCPHKAFPLRNRRSMFQSHWLQSCPKRMSSLRHFPIRHYRCAKPRRQLLLPKRYILLLLHTGSMASAVTRPEVVYAAPLKVNIAGKFAVLGPASVQAPAAFLFAL